MLNSVPGLSKRERPFLRVSRKTSRDQSRVNFWLGIHSCLMPKIFRSETRMALKKAEEGEAPMLPALTTRSLEERKCAWRALWSCRSFRTAWWIQGSRSAKCSSAAPAFRESKIRKYEK